MRESRDGPVRASSGAIGGLGGPCRARRSGAAAPGARRTRTPTCNRLRSVLWAVSVSSHTVIASRAMRDLASTLSRLPRPRPTFQANLASPRLISANLYSAPTCPEDDSDSVRARSSPLCGLCVRALQRQRAPASTAQCCARDRSVPRSNGDRLYNTVRAGVYHGACTLTVGRRRTPRDDTRTGTTTRNQPVEASRKARESCGSGSDSAPLRRKGALRCPL